MNKGTAIVGFILSFIAGMILVWGIGRGGGGASATKDEAGNAAPGSMAVNPGAARVDLYVMSQCPYGVQAEQLFEDVIKKLGPDVDFHVDFIGKKGPNGDFTSLHGPNEVKGDTAQVCAMKYAPTKWYDMVLCQDKSPKEIGSNWEACAQENGIPADKLTACVDGQEGKDLLSASFDRSTAAQATGSPTIVINGEKYQGNRRANDILRTICKAYTTNVPGPCKDIPEAPKVNVTIVADTRCKEKECDTKRLEMSVKQKIANPVITTVDYASAEGKKLYDSIKPANLPAIVFDATLDADKDSMQQLARQLRPAGDHKVMDGGGNWNPTCADDGGCNSDECKNTIQCRTEVAKKLEVFVMSNCPYGVKGLDAMKEVLDNFKKNDVKVDFSVNFIGQGDAGNLSSMHGPGEVEEDIREVCAEKNYAEDLKFMNYIWCRNKNIKDTNWQSCTGGDTGVDADVISKCVESEGKDLLAKSFKYSAASGVRGSPTWFANNMFKFQGFDAETIKTNVCTHNKDLGGCDAKLSGPPAPPAGGAAKAQPGGCGG